MKKPSRKDIAKKTGVSASTVSRVLNGKAESFRISPSTSELVLKIATEIGYIPNQIARGLRTRKSHTIGLIIPNISNPYFSRICRTIEIAARKIGYSIILSDSQEEQQLEIESIRNLRSRNVDGLIILPVGEDINVLKQIIDSKMPLVIADRHFPDLKCPQVISNNYDGAFDAANHLIQNNHQVIGCVQGKHNTSVNNSRMKGFLSALKENNIKINDNYIVGDDFGSRNGYTSTKILLNMNPIPTAIFAFSNLISLGAMRAIMEEKLNIPNDISMITFDDDQPHSEFLATPMSTIAQQTDEIGHVAFKLLMAEIGKEGQTLSKEPKESKIVVLSTKLIERNSVRLLMPSKKLRK